MKNMPQKTVLITGASSGIGAATAVRFAKAGWRVAATMRTPSAAELDEHPSIRRFALDVTDPASIRAAVAAVQEQLGRIDVLVNNAGYALMGPVEALDEAALRRQFDTNVLGLVAVTTAVLPIMRAQQAGTIVNVSSIGGRIAFPLGSAYHATKFAVEGLSESMRYELEPFGVAVKVVEPGGIKTSFIPRGLVWREHPAYAQQVSALRRASADMNDRLPGPEPVAEVIFRAATDGSRRLRYTAKPGPYLVLNRLLPQAFWRRMVGLALRPRGGEDASATA